MVYHKVHMLDGILNRGTEVQRKQIHGRNKKVRIEFFWVITQQLVAISY